MKNVLTFAALYLLSAVAHAASDDGVIKTLYTDADGNLAVQLENGFPNSVAANECSTGNGWAGVSVANSIS